MSHDIKFIETEGDFITGATWNISASTGIKTQLDTTANIFTLKKTESRQSYLLYGCRGDEFKQLKTISGLAISADTKLSITTIVKVSGPLKADLRLLEYDKDRMRIGMQSFRLNSSNTYIPSLNTSFVVVTFRLEGEGGLSVSKLRCKTASMQAPEPVRPITAPPPPKTVVSASPAPVQLTEAQRVQVFMDSVQNEITNTIARLEEGGGTSAELEKAKADLQVATQDAYKWRRRAIGWENLAREREAGNTRKTAFSHDTLSQLAEALPVSNGTRYYAKFPYKVAVITDVYMFNFYKDVFATVSYLSPSTYQEILQETDFDLVIYVTCWKGVQHDEWRGVKFREKPMNALSDILEHCRNKKIPTVFQSIEDPSNFEYFLPLAVQFDVVLTSDVDMIESYKAKCGHDRVFYGEYGANPNLNNPIASMRPALNAAFFAGSYPERYAERCEDMHTIFTSILKHDGTLLIADRNHGSSGLNFPEPYRDSILPPFEHSLLQRVHKLFRYNLNFNSIKSSPTMCAMRVYELQAQGRAQLSNYAKSVFNTFPQLRIVPYPEDLSVYFNTPETFEEQRVNMDCVRNIMSTRTSFDVVGRLLGYLGLEAGTKRPTGVAVVVDTADGTAARYFEEQSYSHKVMLTRNDLPKGAAWRRFVAENDIGYMAVFAEEQEYERFYLEDMLNGFKYTDSDYVTMEAWFDGAELTEGKSHEYTNVMPANWRCVFAVQTCAGQILSGQDVMALDMPVVMERGYSIDPFQLNYTAYCAAQRAMTAKDAEQAQVPRLSVIVPVYNNGHFLLTKCLPSLQRNALWPNMEVLLIDDGSTEDETLDMIADLEQRHANVTVYRYERGGSGSASRPRNKGIEMARADLIAFLDPDNEIATGSYDTLVGLFDELSKDHSELGFVSGFQVKVNETSKAIGRHTDKRTSVITDLKAHFFRRKKFPVISTQCAVIHRSVFEKNKLRFVEKAAGQDTLFGWELVAYAGVGAFTGDAHLIYYAERDGSVTNKLDTEYFEKKVIMEKAQVEALKTHGILETFVEVQLDFFIREWYLKKLALVAKEDRPECARMLSDIIRMYGADPNIYNLAGDDSSERSETKRNSEKVETQ